MTSHPTEQPRLRRSPNDPLTGWGLPTHYRVSGGEVSVITDPHQVAIATTAATRALIASLIRAASSDSNADRSEP